MAHGQKWNENTFAILKNSNFHRVTNEQPEIDWMHLANANAIRRAVMNYKIICNWKPSFHLFARWGLVLTDDVSIYVVHRLLSSVRFPHKELFYGRPHQLPIMQWTHFRMENTPHIFQSEARRRRDRTMDEFNKRNVKLRENWYYYLPKTTNEVTKSHWIHWLFLSFTCFCCTVHSALCPLNPINTWIIYPIYAARTLCLWYFPIHAKCMCLKTFDRQSSARAKALFCPSTKKNSIIKKL